VLLGLLLLLRAFDNRSQSSTAAHASHQITGYKLVETLLVLQLLLLFYSVPAQQPKRTYAASHRMIGSSLVDTLLKARLVRSSGFS
jgi:hypothetical protein